MSVLILGLADHERSILADDMRQAAEDLKKLAGRLETPTEEMAGDLGTVIEYSSVQHDLNRIAKHLQKAIESKLETERELKEMERTANGEN